ncbi:glycosyl hydrolase [Deinococcus misasensis]|uniref:glycosyl hydrolase n=1 Tax=Deinococcus misasensis TaxID=392413 RepID=UPI00068E35DB|nr:glycosyl hydrolase [Deinococcus misasensis]
MSKGRSNLLLGLTLLLASCGNFSAPQPAADHGYRQLDLGATPPPGAKGGPTNSAGAVLTPAWTSNAAAKGKPPTNKFWSSIIFKRNNGNAYSENMFAHPLAMKAKSGGLEISYPTTMKIVGAPGLEKYEYPYTPDLTLGVVGLSSPDTKTDDWGDWTTTALWSNGSNSLKATFGHGLPFVYATKTGGDAQITFIATPTVWSDQGNVLGVTVNGKHYGIFAPTGANWSVNGTIATSSLSGKDYYSVAVLPDNTVATLSEYKKYAYNFVTGSTVSWNYNAATATLTTTFNVTTTAKEGTTTGTVQALYRHQWMNSASVNTPYTYVSPRGEMKVVKGSNSFTTTQKFQGVLPYFPDNGTANTLDKTVLAGFINEVNTPATLNPTGDSYWTGKGLGKLAELVPLAEQVGNTTAQSAFLDSIQRVLEDWLDGKGSNFFYYNPTWGTIIGYPQGYGSEEELNDHHFHYGYFIKAAALLATYRPNWVGGTTPGGKTWGESINDLIMDTANWTSNISQFPRIRNFDAYAGHSWASGHSGFAAGNNQESSSEDMNFSTALINWGSVTGNSAIRDLGIFLYTNETAAIEQYWFNQSGQVFPTEFQKPAVGMVWGDGGAYSTWFSPEKEMIHGINFLPITAGSTYLGRNPAYLKTNYDFLGREPNAWKDIFWSVYAMYDAAGAVSKFGAGGYTPEEGDSKARTYQFIHSLNAMGQVDTTVTANVPNYSVFKKGNTRTYAVFNPGSTNLNVSFSDGFTLTVPPRKVVSSKGADPCMTDKVAPSIPGAFITPIEKTGKAVTLSWPVSTDNCSLAKYEVYMDGALKASVNAPTASTTISGLTPSTTYRFKVRAVDASSNPSAFNTEVAVTTNAPSPCDTDTTLPSVPGVLTSPSQGETSINLSWPVSTDNCGMKAYEIYMNGTLKATVAGNVNTASISGLTANTSYTFKVRAVDTSDNRSGFNAEATFKTKEILIPLLPGTVTNSGGAIANGTSKTFPVNVSSAGTYRLSIQSAATLNSRLINVKFNNASYDLAVDAGQTLIVDFPNVTVGLKDIVITARMDGVNIGTLSGQNLSQPVDPCLNDTTAPSVPASLTSPTKSRTSIDLGWTASQDDCGILKYEVYVDGVLKASPTTNSASITGLTDNTLYKLKVRAIDNKNNISAFSPELSVTTGVPNNTGAIPGVISTNVGAIATGSNQTFNLTMGANGNVRFLITSNSTAPSFGFTINFNGVGVPLSIGAGQTIQVDFANVTSGSKTLTLTANTSGVSIGKLEAVTY